MQPDGGNLRYFKLRSFDLKEFIVLNIQGCKNLKIKKSEFVVETQFLSHTNYIYVCNNMWMQAIRVPIETINNPTYLKIFMFYKLKVKISLIFFLNVYIQYCKTINIEKNKIKEDCKDFILFPFSLH